LNNDNQQFLNLIEDVSEIEYTGDSSQLDLNQIEFFPPGYTIETHYMSIPGMGFGNIAAKYAAPFEKKIKLNSKVFEIDDTEQDAGGEKPVIIKYVENDVIKTVKANTVLVTASLGVLKSGSINFVSRLPDWKQESIDNMGFGVVNKCIMSWNNDGDYVWPRDKLWYLLVTPDDETSGWYLFTYCNSS